MFVVLFVVLLFCLLFCCFVLVGGVLTPKNLLPHFFRALQRDLRTLSPVFVPASKAPIEEEKKEKKEKKEKNEKINLGDLIAVIVFQKSCVDLVGLRD